MSRTGRGPAFRRLGPGIWAGGTVGLLTGLCYVFLLGGVDFSRGRPLSALLSLPPRTIVLLVLLVLAGAGLGILVSLVTPDE